MPDMLTRPGGLQGPPSSTPTAGPAVGVGDAGAAPGGPPESAPNGPAMTGPSVNGLQPVGPPPASLAGPASTRTDPAVNPSASQIGPARGAASPGPAPAGDPLLGPESRPDAAIAAACPTRCRPRRPRRRAASPGSASTAGGPPNAAAGLPALAPATGATETPPALVPAGSPAAPAPTGSPATAPAGAAGDSPPDLGPPAADNRPDGSGPAAGAVQVAGPPALTPVPLGRRGLRPPGPAHGRIRRFPGARARAIARRDPQILRTSLQKAAATPRGSGWRLPGEAPAYPSPGSAMK